MRKRQRGFKKTRKVNKRVKTARALVLTLGFIAFIVISLYSLVYIKGKFFKEREVPEKRFSSSALARLVEEVDGYVVDALFNLGVSIRDVESKKVYEREKGELAWEFKDMRVQLPKGVLEKEVKAVLTESLSKPYIKQEFKKDGGYLISEISVYDVPTHKLRFDFYEEKPERIVKEKTEVAPQSVVKERGERPKIAIIVDDLGLDKDSIDKLVEMPAVLNFAVLPSLPYSKYAAEMAHKNGWDVILHLPMEPKESSGYTASEAGDGALLVGLPKDEILAKLEKNLSSLPHIKGVNNHMGSKFTENGELMELVLKRIKSKGLFFVDSRTSPNTTGYQIAKKLGVKTAQRDFFLDNASRNQDYIRSQIRKLVNISKKKGYAIGICHPYPSTVEVLSQIIPEMKKEVDIVPVSGVVN
jgi:polysaccharide deacetylase 2 family uncharacterized protein YibQ